jgi:hypothetical protein
VIVASLDAVTVGVDLREAVGSRVAGFAGAPTSS